MSAPSSTGAPRPEADPAHRAGSADDRSRGEGGAGADAQAAPEVDAQGEGRTGRGADGALAPRPDAPAGAEAGEGAAEAPPTLPAWAERANANPGEVILLGLRRAAPPGPPAAAAAALAALPPLSGLLVIDKPAGMTSHDVVQAVRRAGGERRVGHAGTLDPMATGVLVVCLGAATRVVEEVQRGLKGYSARVTLGIATSTYDAEGEAVATADPSHVDRAALETAMAAFRGPIRQVPPMVSALKHQGRRLYDLAREGREVERPPRDVVVHRLELVDWSPPDATLELVVTSGTYVRSIAHDLGQALGVGAHLSALRRTFVGPFALEEAVPLATAVEALREGWWPPLLHPLDAALTAYDALIVGEDAEADMRNGRRFAGPPPRDPARHRIRVYGSETGFVGVARWDEEAGLWRPERVFPRASARP